MNNASWPATIDVRPQSNRIVPVRSRANPKVMPFGRIRKAAAEIELNIGGGSRATYFRTKSLEPELGLAQAASKRCAWNERTGSGSQGGEIFIVDPAYIVEGIEQNDTGETNAIFGSAFDLRLVLVVNFGG